MSIVKNVKLQTGRGYDVSNNFSYKYKTILIDALGF